MVDAAKQVAYWRDGAAEEWAVAGELLEKNHLRHALFFAHLTLEKILKAHVCKTTEDLAPRLHDLLRLLDLAQIALPQSDRDQLRLLGIYQMAGRYPDQMPQLPTLEQARERFQEAGRIYRWLLQRL
jgi:HEPN domain-containing protein